MDVIYLAAGQGTRARLGYPKQFARIGGKPLLVHGLEMLERLPEITRVLVACCDISSTQRILEAYDLQKIVCVRGGNTRQESVRLALEHVRSDYVLIHEAVRPFVSDDFIRGIIAVQSDCVVPFKHAVSTAITRSGCCLDRRAVGEVQMPQKYKTELLRDAHALAAKSEHARFAEGLATDDADLVYHVLGVVPDVCDGLEANIKITTPLDLVVAEAIYHANSNNGE